MEPPRRHIAHLDLDSFYVSVERLRNPALIGKPVLIGGASIRSVVASCSYEAREYGIHSAMSMKTARKLCADAIIVDVNMEAYSKYSGIVTDIIRDSVPLFEKASIDEFYVDMTGMDRFFGCMEYMAAVKDKIKKECGLPTSFALSSNKLVSKVAVNEVKPNGQIEVPHGQEKAFLAPLSVTKIPGVGKQTAAALAKIGILTVRALSETPVAKLQHLMGKSGAELWQRANGIDDSPVIPYHEQKSISTENTFLQDTVDMHFIHSEIVRMTEAIAYEMRSQNKLAGCVTIKLRYANFETFTIQKAIPYTHSDEVLIRTASALFDKLYNHHMAIRLLGVRLTNLANGSYQISLFDNTEESTKLYKAIDSVKNKFGEQYLVKASGIGGKRPPEQ